MINLSECKFGDRLRTKGGQMALFLGNKRQLTSNVCAIEDESLGYLSLHYNDNGTPSYPVRSKYHIVGRWEDEQEPTLRMLDSKDGIPQETEETET